MSTGICEAGLAGRSVLITGASSGIGAALAVGFGRAGARVALHYNRNTAVHAVADEANRAGAAETVVLRGDFTDPGAPGKVVDATAESFGGLDVLVNNAGDIGDRRPLGEIDDEFLDGVLQLNFSSVVRASRAAYPHLRESRGSIVNVTSLAASTGGGGNSSIYAAAKGAVSSFTRALAKDLAAEGIRANALSPGVIATPLHDRHTTAEGMAARAQQTPLARIGDPEDCVGAVLFLASEPASGYVTGQILEVNGGRFMR
jgi:3-oxoacyl-[acyl-carrier protein] reductase